MEQRPLRLGDIVDDYCPRERRITNHAIVAIVEDAIRQTRCTTCDTEHVFKQGREPRRRRKEPDSLYEQVLADIGGQLVPPRQADEDEPETGAEAAADMSESSGEPQPAEPAAEEGWPAHRRLIRASLPRIEGEVPPPRPIPEFTMHQKPQARPGRGPRFQGPSPQFAGGGRDGRFNRSPARDNGNGFGNGNGNGNGHHPGRRSGPNKRGR